jgi:hypothetical protein
MDRRQPINQLLIKLVQNSVLAIFNREPPASRVAGSCHKSGIRIPRVTRSAW